MNLDYPIRELGPVFTQWLCWLHVKCYYISFCFNAVFIFYPSNRQLELFNKFISDSLNVY